jgi:hypothetical protein
MFEESNKEFMGFIPLSVSDGKSDPILPGAYYYIQFLDDSGNIKAECTNLIFFYGHNLNNNNINVIYMPNMKNINTGSSVSYAYTGTNTNGYSSMKCIEENNKDYVIIHRWPKTSVEYPYVHFQVPIDITTIKMYPLTTFSRTINN